MVYYQNPANQNVYGYDPDTQQSLINNAISAGWTLMPVWPLPVNDTILLSQCKQTASSLLYQTDWTVIPDVSNPDNTPHLTNKDEFVAYRNLIRALAINPVTNPVWPQKPTAQWSVT